MDRVGSRVPPLEIFRLFTLSASVLLKQVQFECYVVCNYHGVGLWWLEGAHGLWTKELLLRGPTGLGETGTSICRPPPPADLRVERVQLGIGY